MMGCAVLLWAGCDRGSHRSGDDHEPRSKKTFETEDGMRPAARGHDKAAAKPGASQPGAAQPAVAKPALPTGRSPVPKLAEWNAQSREVTVKGSSALNCETKMVREWLRVSCRGKNDTGGTPTTVQVVRGGRPGEVFSFAAGGVTSLVMPFVDGVRLDAVFSWTDKSHKLVVNWPHGAPKPPIIAVFEGAASPLDGTAGGDAALERKLCACYRKVFPSEYGSLNCASGNNQLGANADCARTYANDCASFIACSHGEPGVSPRCLAGYRNAGAASFCVKICGQGQSCPAGTSCSTDWGSPAVCF